MNTMPANENGRKSLIGGSSPRRGGMNTATSPATKSVDENVQTLSTVCHVCEVQAPYALVHASPVALAEIIGKLGFTVSPSQKGGDYYAVRVAAKVALVPQARHLSVAPAPQAVAPAPAPQVADGTTRMNIGGTNYIVRETATKRTQDVRRWEVRKVGEEVAAPYVVTFQSHDGSRTACSCKGGIYHKHCKHMDACKAAYGRRTAATTNVA